MPFKKKKKKERERERIARVEMRKMSVRLYTFSGSKKGKKPKIYHSQILPRHRLCWQTFVPWTLSQLFPFVLKEFFDFLIHLVSPNRSLRHSIVPFVESDRILCERRERGEEKREEEEKQKSTRGIHQENEDRGCKIGRRREEERGGERRREEERGGDLDQKQSKK